MNRISILLLFLSLVISQLHSQTNFTKVTDVANPIVTDPGSQSGSYTGASWIDMNDDGKLDLFINQGPLYRNEGGGIFTKLTSAITNQGAAFANSWSDFDNDGDIDCFISGGNPNGSILYRNDGNEIFTAVTSGDIGSSSANKGWGCAWADYDNDGYTDVVIAAAFGFAGISTPNRLFHNNHDGTFTRIDTGVVVSVTAPYTVPSWSDFDGDGDMDLFIGAGPANGTILPDYLFRNMLKETGTAFFKKITTGVIATDSRDGQIFNWIDYDNDGDLDVYITNYGGGALPGIKNDLYRNDGGSFVKVTVGDIVNHVDHSLSSVWEDFDNDGDMDCFVTNDGTSPNRYYENTGGGSFTTIVSGALVTSPGPHYGASAGDYDGDGDLDLFVSGAGGAKGLFRNDLASGNSWLGIRCIGTISNKSAIGTKIWTFATIQGIPTWQLREISAQNSFNSQNSLIAHFGFADAASIDSLKIEWPSGVIERFSNVQPNQYLTVAEADSGDVMLFTPAEGELNQLPEILLRWRRNVYGRPYHIQVTTDSTFSGGFVINDSLVSDTIKLVSILSNNSTYYWRVRSAGNIHKGVWSEVRSFSNEVIPPTLLFPPDGGKFPVSVVLRWATLGGAVGYDVEVGSDSTFAVLVTQGDNVPDSALTVDSLTLDSTYYWRVRARTVSVTGDWSQVRYFVAESVTVILENTDRWNIVSVPLTGINSLKDSLYPLSITSAYSYSADSGYVENDSLEGLKGYWLKFSNPQERTISGSSSADRIRVHHGWNLIGAMSTPVSVNGLSTIPPGIISSSVFGYDGGYAIGDSLRPGKGYWVKMSDDGDLFYQSTLLHGFAGKAMIPNGFSNKTILTDLSSLVIQDAGGHEQILYFGGSRIVNSVDLWELPPAPPAGVFDVRYEEGTSAVFAEEGMTKRNSIVISSALYPLTIRPLLQKNTNAQLSINGKTNVLTSKETLHLFQKPAEVTLSFTQGRDESEFFAGNFSLEQNYPNPFNPETKIRFSLPMSGLATIKIFDILGREVATLLEEELEAGDHSIQFNAHHLSSGVYYYKLAAGSFLEFKRMILSK